MPTVPLPQTVLLAHSFSESEPFTKTAIFSASGHFTPTAEINSGLSGGAVAGIVVSVIAVVSAVAAALVYVRSFHFFREQIPSDSSDVDESTPATTFVTNVTNAEIVSSSDGLPSVMFESLVN
jgi:hypothetical protein